MVFETILGLGFAAEPKVYTFALFAPTDEDGWTEQCFTSPPTQHRLYGRRFLQGKRPNQQYQSTEGTNTVHQ